MNDLFGNGPAQLGFDLDEQSGPRSYEPDRDDVRAELTAILAQARAARDKSPWDRRTLRYHQVVFPQMANWLPAAERDPLRFEFATEMARIEALIAA